MNSRERIAVTQDREVLGRVQMQEESMFLARLKKRYGWNFVFRVGIDTQEVLPFGGKGGIFAEVKDEIEIRVRDGCRILAPAHRVRNDVSVENLNNFI